MRRVPITGGVVAECPPARWFPARRGRAGLAAPAAAAIWLAGLALGLRPVPAAADDIDPKVLPDRIEDIGDPQPDPFPTFDNFAWRAFVALNWPALADPEHRGMPDRSKAFGDPGPRVWETFKSRYEVFGRDPAGRAVVPAKWHSYEARNPCGPGADNRTKTLKSFNGFADFNQAGLELGKLANPLVAQNRTYTRYEVRINQEEFDTIVGRKWYIRDNLPTPQQPGTFAVGSIQVKAAWRVLTDQDTPAIRKRYYVVNDALVDESTKAGRAGAGCSRRDVALVGLHIVVKTKSRPQWIWSSFEHVDNVPPAGSGDAREPDAQDAGAPYSYNDPNKPAALDPPFYSSLVNTVDARNPPKENPDPMQVVRRHPINVETMARNRAYWELPEIRNTVWANYMLVTTQWPTAPSPTGPGNDGKPFPGPKVEPDSPASRYRFPGSDDANAEPNLANTAMETYRQYRSTSCMACHQLVSNALGRDFVAFIGFDANRPPR